MYSLSFFLFFFTHSTQFNFLRKLFRDVHFHLTSNKRTNKRTVRFTVKMPKEKMSKEKTSKKKGRKTNVERKNVERKKSKKNVDHVICRKL